MAGISQLEVLVVDHNELTGTVPRLWGQMDELRLLRIDHNKLSGMEEHGSRCIEAC